MCPCVSPSPKYELESGGFDKDQCQPHRDGEAWGGGCQGHQGLGRQGTVPK